MTIRELKTEALEDAEAVITLLDSVSEKAKGRGIRAVAIVTVHADSTVGLGYVSGQHYYPLLGGLTDLQHQIVADADE
jgi:hypothetical protein